ncbi:mannosyl-oligosaccharide 1,2-alpha-mannosidase [Stachybotrys elegans]|uniref:alpha-1,2-Mannosidase n=1 Tax=Stachybotrys elegans TaxID=80388 RepID=A0A8K0T6Q0_9HYPO|nr:mannosyl-oligosaccharide 1,2-alpha-mannosidase [Stachybotrys elegans]
MIRDPFNIHKKNVFRATAARAAQSVSDTVVQVGTQALDMSFSVPKNVPNFGAAGREFEDRAWASVSGPRPGKGKGIMDGVQDRVNGLFDKKALPMYKDKPYLYAPSLRKRPMWKRKRILGSGALFLFFFLYMAGFFSSSSDNTLQTTPSSGWLWSSVAQEKGGHDWAKRRELVVEAFELSWDAYVRYAWGYDEYHPVEKTGRKMSPEGLGWIIIDSLDTMMIMNLTSRLEHARKWLTTSLTWDQNQDVSTFETTIRMLGGLLAAHYLSNEFPELAPIAGDDPGSPGEDLYLEKAKDLGDRLLSAFDTPSGIPYSSVNLEKYKGIPSHDDMGAASTAEATSVQLEFKYLAKLTGERYFWDAAEKVMQVIDDNHPEDGLVPIYIYPTNGEFRGENIRLGSRGDSYYEYLIKQYLQTQKSEKVYLDMWEESLKGIRKHLITYTEPSGFTIVAERPDGLKQRLFPKMDHLVCFLPGTIALAVTEGLPESEARKLPSWSKKKEEEMELAKELMHTCWATYKYMATGLAAEITHFNIADPPLPESAAHNAPQEFDPDPEAEWRKDFIVKANDVHNLQRPETVESLFYMWRITGDEKYREWGWEMFKSFMNYTAVPEGGGFTSLSNANVIPPKIKDNMESFWLAETLKYMYLLFSPNDLLPLDKIVLNTEAHPFPRFEMGRLFSTGWERKPAPKESEAKAQVKE